MNSEIYNVDMRKFCLFDSHRLHQPQRGRTRRIRRRLAGFCGIFVFRGVGERYKNVVGVVGAGGAEVEADGSPRFTTQQSPTALPTVGDCFYLLH